MPHPRLKLNAGRTNCDGIVAEIGLVFTDFGGVFGLYQLELNTLFHRLRYWKIRVLENVIIDVSMYSAILEKDVFLGLSLYRGLNTCYR